MINPLVSINKKIPVTEKDGVDIYKEYSTEEIDVIDSIKRFATKNKVTYMFIYYCYLIYEKGISLFFQFMKIIPINDKKIVFTSAKGKRYGDNPMYISDELLKRKKNYKLVWLLNKNVKEDVPKGIIRVDYTLKNVIYELVTSKVWVDSNMKYSGFLKRKKQLYIQTWHGSYGLKKIAGDLGDKLSPIDKRIIEYNVKRMDLMVSNSKRTSEIYRNAFWYSGEVLEYGSPRNDIFFENPKYIRRKVDSLLGINGKRIVLYAPTYRNNYRIDDLKLDYTRLLNALSDKFEGEWVVLIRLHPNNMIDADGFIRYTDKIINATNYSVMQELLLVSDVLITDYSSCMFDFITTGKKCFLYASDLERYDRERGCYFSLNELPFPLAQNNDELVENIQTFDQSKYEAKIKRLFETVGLNETGHASEKVADYIEEWMANN